jgi:hypothetical protein
VFTSLVRIRTREQQADVLAGQILEISDDGPNNYTQTEDGQAANQLVKTEPGYLASSLSRTIAPGGELTTNRLFVSSVSRAPSRASASSDAGYGYWHPSAAKSRLDALLVERIADCLKGRTGASHRLDAISYLRFARSFTIRFTASTGIISLVVFRSFRLEQDDPHVNRH